MFIDNIMEKPFELLVYSKEFVTKYDCYKSNVHMGKLKHDLRMEEELDKNPNAIGLQERFEIEFDRQLSVESFDHEIYRFMHDFINTYIIDYKPDVHPKSDYSEIYKGSPNPKVRYKDRRDRTKLLEYFSKIYSNGKEDEIMKKLI